MKRKLTIICLSLLISVGCLQAQNPRMLMFECFTNTSCGPCAAYNPALDALIDANPETIAAIKYHMNWPGANDPMYLHNPVDNNAKKSLYNVNAVPHAVVSGNLFGGSPADINQNMVNNWAAVESAFEMRMSTQLNNTQDTIRVIVMGKASAAVTGTLKLQVGVIEKHIHYNNPPGSNGERDFYSVMKKMLPTAGGTTLPTMGAGDYFCLSFEWALANVYDINELAAVAWIQDNSTKEIHQACKSSASMTPFYANEGSISDIINTKSVVCSGKMHPSFELSNNGSNAITSATIEALVNDEVVKTLDWTGSIPSLSKKMIDLGEIEYTVAPENNLIIRISTLNGSADEFQGNDSKSISFDASPAIAEKVMKLSIRTDDNPQETTWELKSMTTGNVVLSGGPYETANTMYTETWDMPGDDCYEFTIYDAGGNGLNAGSGIYGLKAGSTTIFSGKDFKDFESNEFSYELHLGSDEISNQSVFVYPNPASENLSIVAQGTNTVTIYNAMGQELYRGSFENQSQIDLSKIGKGIIIVHVSGTSGTTTKRIVVE